MKKLTDCRGNRRVGLDQVVGLDGRKTDCSGDRGNLVEEVRGKNVQSAEETFGDCGATADFAHCFTVKFFVCSQVTDFKRLHEYISWIE